MLKVEAEELERQVELTDELAVQQSIIRLAALGEDREFSQYFLFTSAPGLYKCTSGGEWSVMTTADDVNALLEALSERGVREHALKQGLKAREEDLKKALKHADAMVAPAAEPVAPVDAASVDALLVEHLRNDLLVFNDQVCEGGFGHARSESWIRKTSEAATAADLAKQLKDIEENLDLRFLQPPLGPDLKRQKNPDELEETEALESWREAVDQCRTPAQVRPATARQTNKQKKKKNKKKERY